MSERARIIASLTRAPAPGEAARWADRAELLEVRADLGLKLDPEALRSEFGGRLLYTLRSQAEGGRSERSTRARGRALAAAARQYDLVDLEAERDLEPELLEQVPPEKRVISWHGGARPSEDLRELFGTMSRHPAALYKMVPEARTVKEALAPLALLRSIERADLVAFAGGPSGVWTRLLAPRLGAPVVFAAAGDEPAAPGQPGLDRLCRDFGLPELPPVEKLFGIVGNPVHRSLSPRLHNAAYREAGAPSLYLPFELPVFGDFWLDLVESGSLDVLGFSLGGLSVTAPFKEIAQAVAGASSPLAERIGSANTLVRRGGVWEAETTDPEGVAGPLREAGVDPRGWESAVVGSGGAGRAASFGLARLGARVTLVNRGTERGSRVARELGVDFVPLERFDASRYRLLVNATPLGVDAGSELPFAPEDLAPQAVVVDLAYAPGRATELVRQVRALGRLAIDGREVLLHQAIPQYRLMTGEEMPVALGRRMLELEPEP